MPSGSTSKADRAPFKLLLWTAIAGLIFGLIGFGEIAEDLLRSGRNSLHWHKASGDIVLVKIDDEALHQVGRWPWSRRTHAEMAKVLSEAGAKRIFFDVEFFAVTDPLDDRQFADALRRARAVIAVRTLAGTNASGPRKIAPPPVLANIQVATVDFQYNYQNAIWRVPYSMDWNGREIPSFAAMLAGRTGTPKGTFIPDYSLDPKSVPAISAAKLLSGQFDPRLIRGKEVVVGADSDGVGDQYFIPGSGKMGGAYVHIIAAETLKSGTPIYLGWIPLFILALGTAAVAVRRSSPRAQTLILAALIAGLLLGPAFFEARLIYLDMTPALFVALVTAGALIRRHFKHRGLVNAVSGLPNLNALRANVAGRNQSLIVARILNYADVVAALPTDSERQLVEQIVGRLSIGSSDRIFYQGDGGIFAWFEEPRKPFGHHIDALYALFRNPIRVADLSVDLSISFGVEIGSGRALATRLASALVAAEEAAHDGLKWKCHDPETVENASWRLSMLSQLDAAIDKGEVWIAFQPQLDLKSRRIIGAEALARWTHPDKGPIAASEFVAAAEQHDRIGKLTDFVLEKAVTAAAAINKRGNEFSVAVNLSARLLTDKQFVMRVTALLARQGLDPSRLTLELTETSELVDSGESLETLNRLRDLGIEVSIDDYGTGLSTLEYMKKVPATEIKIDQSFVKGLSDNRSDRLMVHSTIGLAHSLGRKVVAEGVEQQEILDALIDMECDVAQGYIVGRPMSLDALLKRISNDRRRVA